MLHGSHGGLQKPGKARPPATHDMFLPAFCTRPLLTPARNSNAQVVPERHIFPFETHEVAEKQKLAENITSGKEQTPPIL